MPLQSRHRRGHRAHPASAARTAAAPTSSGWTPWPPAGRARTALSCANLAHAFAACGADDKDQLQRSRQRPTSASSPPTTTCSRPISRYERVPRADPRGGARGRRHRPGRRRRARHVRRRHPGPGRHGAVAVQPRRDRAWRTAVALSHDVFDGALMLGICDKIVPGLVIGALAFGHLPTIFVPGGPDAVRHRPTARRPRCASSTPRASSAARSCWTAESASYHAPGTCTFYGTANSNQMLMEIMGLHLPGAAFVNPNTPLRDALTAAATAARGRDHGARQRLHAGRPGARRARLRQRASSA